MLMLVLPMSIAIMFTICVSSFLTSVPIHGLRSAIPFFSYFLACAFLLNSYADVNLKPARNFCCVWPDETNTGGSFVYTAIFFWYTWCMDMLGFPDI